MTGVLSEWVLWAALVAACAAAVCSLESSAYAASSERLQHHVKTEDAKLNILVGKLFNDCVFSKLFDPKPPALPNKWFSPGGGYVGQWIWDTMFVLMAYAAMGEDETIRGVFENYWHTIDNNPEAPKGSPAYGMVPNFLEPWPPLGYSQIPILAWGCEIVYRQTNDKTLIERALPYLITFDEWYSTERDVDDDGLIEYGAYKQIWTAGMVQTARFETFDCEPTLDNMKMTKHPRRDSGGEWYGNVEGVDQTCFLVMSERAIIRMARELGQESLAERYEKIVARRVKAIQEKMWDPKTGFFYSLDRDTHEKIPVRTIQGFLPLTCDAATKEQAVTLVGHLMDPKQWWCTYPIPTAAMDDPKYEENGFWRGDVWPPTTYLVSLGLNHYGFTDVAYDLTARTQRLIVEHGINERYNGRTGQPLGVPGLGMTCAIWAMIVQNVYGIQEDFRTIRIPSDAKGRRLTFGKLVVSYPSANSVELRTGFGRQFDVIFPTTEGALKARVTCNGQPVPAGQLRVSGRTVSFTAEPDKLYLLAADH